MPAKRAKAKPKAKKTSGKRTSLKTIRDEVLGEFRSKATRPLTTSGEQALSDMFQITVAKFKRSAAVKAPKIDLWTVGDGRFRTFILGEARKIAVAASREAGSGNIDATVLNKAGLTTMLATNTHCDVAISQGKLILDGSQLQGTVCSAFLEQQASL